MALAGNRKRARSDDEKGARRAAILEAARHLVELQGFDGVTMSALANEAGLSKGALYLYVRTKEEVFLALFVEALGTLTDRVEAEATPETLADLLSRVPQEVPLFLPLLARVVAVIERNVADEPLFEAKRAMHRLGARMAAILERNTGASARDAMDATSVLLMAMQGAAQFGLTADRDLATVPEDMRPLFAGQSFGDRYPVAVRLILKGL